MIKTHLTKLLGDNKYTHKTFAEKVGIDRTYITRIANGKIMPTVETIIKILTALNVKFEQVWYKVPDQKSAKKEAK